MIGVMIAKISRTVVLLIALGNLAGCDFLLSEPESPDPSQTKEAIATRETPAELMYQGPLAGKPAFLLVHDCEVYSVEKGAKGAVRWTSVLAPEFYPFWTVCQRQSMSFDAGTLTVTLGRTAMGAGGCCATGGTYRSVDGLTWKKDWAPHGGQARKLSGRADAQAPCSNVDHASSSRDGALGIIRG